MTLLQQFTSFITKESLFSQKDRLLLAVSGGVDSVVLCELCQQAGYDFIIAHCNFQLRGEESERDEAFVKELGKKYNKEVLVKRFDTQEYASNKKVSIQVAARELRYAWFNEVVSRESSGVSPEAPIKIEKGKRTDNNKLDNILSNPNHAGSVTDDSRLTPDDDSPLTTHHSPIRSYLLTAHHLDDNIETVLMNFFKGTGIAGLRGILPKQGKIIRPLLFAKKEDLKTFAVENKLSWVEDSSNETDKYARNYFRNQIIPLIETRYPEALHNLGDNLSRFRDIELLYQQSIEQHKKKLLEYKGSEVHIPVLKLKKAAPLLSVVYEIIKDYGFSAAQSDDVIELLDSETGRYIASLTHRIIKNRNWIIISPVQSGQAAHILIENTDHAVVFEKGKLSFQLSQEAPFPVQQDKHIAWLDAAHITFPLLLRKWKTGDYFYPLGMQKKKKVARFLIDAKLSKTDKEQVWVIESNKKIVWIVGHRIDDRFKISPHTKQLLRITLSS